MKDRPRILMLVQRFPPDIGGLASSGARIAGALAAAGADVDVFAWTKTLAGGVVESGPAVPLAALPLAASAPRLHRMGLFGHEDLSWQHTLNFLEWLHGQRRFGLVWGHYLYPPGFVAVWFAKQTGVPAIVSVRGNDLDKLMFPPGDFARLSWTLQHANLITSVSADLARKVELLVTPQRPVLVTPNAVNTDIFQPGPPDAALRTALGIEPDEKVLGFSGELRHKKGLTFLLQALPAVRAKTRACLLVIGEVRASEQLALAQFAAEQPDAARRLIVTGHLEDPARVAAHLRLCDLFLMPSIWDGLPNALLEAMACGRVSLASDAGGIPECLSHGMNGFLLPKTMLHRLGEAALEALSLADEPRRKIEQGARATILSRFSAEAEQRSLAEALRLTAPSALPARPGTPRPTARRNAAR